MRWIICEQELVLQNEMNELLYIVEQANARDMKIVLNPSPMNEKIWKLPLKYIDYFMLNEIEAKVEAVDTTAAGDTFTGFFIGGIQRGLRVKEAMELASRASAIVVTREGAAPSIPTCAEVEEILKKEGK